MSFPARPRFAAHERVVFQGPTAFMEGRANVGAAAPTFSLASVNSNGSGQSGGGGSFSLAKAGLVLPGHLRIETQSNTEVYQRPRAGASVRKLTPVTVQRSSPGSPDSERTTSPSTMPHAPDSGLTITTNASPSRALNREGSSPTRGARTNLNTTSSQAFSAVSQKGGALGSALGTKHSLHKTVSIQDERDAAKPSAAAAAAGSDVTTWSPRVQAMMGAKNGVPAFAGPSSGAPAVPAKSKIRKQRSLKPSSSLALSRTGSF